MERELLENILRVTAFLLVPAFYYYYAIESAFWLIFLLNFPFLLFRSDWTLSCNNFAKSEIILK